MLDIIPIDANERAHAARDAKVFNGALAPLAHRVVLLSLARSATSSGGGSGRGRGEGICWRGGGREGVAGTEGGGVLGATENGGGRRGRGAVREEESEEVVMERES